MALLDQEEQRLECFRAEIEVLAVAAQAAEIWPDFDVRVTNETRRQRHRDLNWERRRLALAAPKRKLAALFRRACLPSSPDLLASVLICLLIGSRS